MKKILIVSFLLFTTNSIFSQNKITISNINIAGNKVTEKEIILREVLLIAGESYEKSQIKELISKSKENLVNLKLFNFIEIKENLTGNNMSITIKVIERWYFWVFPIFELSNRNFNSWWKELKESNYKDFSSVNYGLFLNWENFRGKNQLLQIKIRKGFKEHYKFFYSIPYLNKKKTIGIETSVELFRRKSSFYNTENNQLVYYTGNNYTTKDFELYTQVTYRKGINIKHDINIKYLVSNVDSNIANLNPNYLNNNLNTGSYIKTTYRFTNEHRDYVEYPLNGYYLMLELSKFIGDKSPINHIEILGKAEKHITINNLFSLGSSFTSKISSAGFHPYFSQTGFGFNHYVRGYEYYVIDSQNFWLSKTILKLPIIKKRKFDVPFIKLQQFKKSHYSLYAGVFSDMGYAIEKQNYEKNNLTNSFLWGNGIGIDYLTYYDKLLRIEFSINRLGEKGVFLHLSNPF
tara:strand:- start:1090 stop:2475 length:1386 start_codon:yes stop_codon:yes gene_type:complete